jgi:hypothetical protein
MEGRDIQCRRGKGGKKESRQQTKGIVIQRNEIRRKRNPKVKTHLSPFPCIQKSKAATDVKFQVSVIA